MDIERAEKASKIVHTALSTVVQENMDTIVDIVVEGGAKYATLHSTFTFELEYVLEELRPTIEEKIRARYKSMMSLNHVRGKV